MNGNHRNSKYMLNQPWWNENLHCTCTAFWLGISNLIFIFQWEWVHPIYFPHNKSLNKPVVAPIVKYGSEGNYEAECKVSFAEIWVSEKIGEYFGNDELIVKRELERLWTIMDCTPSHEMCVCVLIELGLWTWSAHIILIDHASNIAKVIIRHILFYLKL